jgi:hypothetical protein
MVESGKPASGLSTASAMGRVEEVAMPSPWVQRWQRPIFIACLALWAANLACVFLRIEHSPACDWLEGLWLVFAVMATLLALATRLPLQNALTTGVLIAFLSGVVVALADASGIPFGPIIYTALGEKIFHAVPWPAPLGWIFLIVNGRGIARLIMRPWRKTNYYGFWVIGLTCLLVVIFDLGLEPFAVYVKDYWIWQTPKPVPAWYTAPWVNFPGWFVTSLAILTFAMPWLINKQPVKQPIDYRPLVLWWLFIIWTMAGNAMHHLWPAVAVSLAGNVVMTIFAVRGARW